MKPKKELIRIVRNKEGEVFVDPTGKKNGRGAYLSRDLNVVDQAIKSKALNKAFETDIDASLYEEIKELIEREQ